MGIMPVQMEKEGKLPRLKLRPFINQEPILRMLCKKVGKEEENNFKLQRGLLKHMRNLKKSNLSLRRLGLQGEMG